MGTGPFMSDALVVMLHGLHAGPWQLRPLARHLETHGHRTVLLDFPTRLGLDTCVAMARAQLTHREDPVTLVGFSFGSLVARGLAHALGERAKLLVQIAPPNRGSAWAGRMFFGAPLLGVRDLVPGSPALAALPVPSCPIAVLAGTVKLSPRVPITWPIALANVIARVDEPGDGTVTLAETQLPSGAEVDRLHLPYAHDHLPSASEVHAQVAHLLQHGRFKRLSPAARSR